MDDLHLAALYRDVREALSDRVEYVEDDYRNIRGQFDVFVSVGMLEHVGPENYRTLGAVIDHCLKDSGRGLVHSVGGNTREPMNEWLEKRIFPGSYVPTLREMMEVFEPFAFSILDVENLRLHYAKTLKEWLHRSIKIAKGFMISMTRRSCAPGAYILPAAAPPSLPVHCSFTKSCLPGLTKTTCPGRASICMGRGTISPQTVDHA
jgi:Mycolic acid cyclopropane synthetase